MLPGVICYWKMTSFMALDGVTSFLRARKERATWSHLLLENDVIHDVRRCNVVFTHEKRYKYT